MPVQTPFGPGLIGQMNDRLWNVVKKTATAAVTFEKPPVEGALVECSKGKNIRPYTGKFVKTMNALEGDVVFAVGWNFTLTASENTLTLGLKAMPVYANNAAAVAGGLPVGALYRNGADPDHVCIVH